MADLKRCPNCAGRDSRVQKYLSDQAAAKESLATYPESIRARLLAWQEAQHEFFMDTILEIVAEFIAFEDRCSEPAADAVEAVADSGFTAENITEAEWLWANLPVRGKFHDRPTYERALICHTVARFRARAAITAMPAPQWLDIASAKKNRSTIWAILRDDIYPTLMPGREDLKRWNGLQLPLRHEGVADDGFDIGWMLAAPVGHGGFPDDWIAGWMPMPAAPAKEGIDHG